MLLESRNFDGAGGAVGGETATLGEIWDSTHDSMRLVENLNSRNVALERAYDARIDRIFEATGQRLNNPARIVPAFDEVADGLGLPPGDPHSYFQQQLEDLQTQHPKFSGVIRADRPVIEDARRLAAEAEGHLADVWARSAGGLGDWTARLAGGFSGMAMDPVNIAMMAVGPWGEAGLGARGLLWMSLKVGAANSGAEAAIQPMVQSWRKEAGLDYGLDIAATNILAAGAFGFGLDAGVRSIVRGGRRLAGRPYLGPRPDPKADPAAALEVAARELPKDHVLRKAADGDPDALREVARATGQDEDAIVRGGLQALDAEEAFRGLARPSEEFTSAEGLSDTAGAIRAMVSQTEHDLQLNKTIRHAAGAPDAPPPGHAVAAPPARPGPVLRDSAEAQLGATEMLEGKPVTFMAVDPQKVVSDATTFQFKSEGDASGVTARLRGVKRWDPLSAGKAFIFERANGEQVIADGHQRLGLAKRLADQNPQLHAYIFREADGWTPADVRAHAAMKNMRELSGSSLDMAKVMRERPDLVDDSLPLSDGKMREAAMLARLSDEAFGAVVAGRLPAPFAALIGEHVTDAGRHAGLLNEIAAADLANGAQARFYLAQLMELPTTTETQITLFGEEAITRTLMAERSRVLDSSLKTLKGDKRIFGLLDREASRITSSGNVLDREANAARAQNAAELAELIEKLATTSGVVATLLNDASIAVSRGLAPAQAGRAFVRRIGDILDEEGINGLLKAEPQTPSPEGRIDDPNGPDAKAQLEELEASDDQGVMFALTSHGKQDWQAQLQEFFDNARRNVWIDGEGFKIYIRQSQRPDPSSGEALRTLEIGSVEVDPDAQGKGTFKDILDSATAAARANDIDALYVESVMTDQFADFFRRVGWAEVEALFPGEPPSFLLRLDAKDVEFKQQMFALPGEPRTPAGVLDFPNSGNKGRLAVLDKQLADIHGRIDAAREEISTINAKGDLSPADDARISELSNTIDALREEADPIMTEAAGLEDKKHKAQLASGIYDKVSEATNRARSLRNERQDLEKEIKKLEEAVTNEPGDFLSQRRLQIASRRLGEVVDAVTNAVEEADALIKIADDQKFSIAGNPILPKAAPYGGRAAPSPRYSAEAVALRAEIDKTMNRVLPVNWRHEARDTLVYGGRTVEGRADPYERIVYVSLAALDPLERAFEEAGHALKVSGLIPPADYDILRAEAKQLGAREHFEIDKRYGPAYGRRWQNNPGRLEDALEEEAVMQMIAAHARGRTSPGFQPAPAVKRIMDRIAKFFRAIQKALSLRNLRTYEDVFEEIVSGQTASRAMPETERAISLGRMREVMFSTTGAGAGAGGGRRPGNIRDLINGELAEGRITRQDADDMLARYDELEQHYQNNPAQAAQQLAQEIDAEALHRQRLRLLAEQRQEEIENFLMDFRDERGQADPARAMIALLEHNGVVPMPKGFSSAAGREHAIIGTTMARMEAMLAEFSRTRITGATRNRARLENVVRELFDQDSGDDAARQFARIWTQVADDLRQRSNAAGSAIGHLQQWGLPQSHNRVTMLRAGMERWVSDITPLLDPDRMRSPLTGNAMTREELRRSLEWIYREVTSDGWHEREASMVRRGIGSVANQRGAHRFLIFKDADGWMNYQATYGGGANPFVTMMGHIRGMARDIADMETLGPNPRAMLTFMQEVVEKHAAQRAAGLPALFPEVTRLSGRRVAGEGEWVRVKNAQDYGRSMVKLAEDMYNIRRGHSGAAINSRVAAVFDAVRNLQVSALLGGATISAISDVAFQRSARAFAGLPQTRIIGDLVRENFSRASRFDAVRAGLILDSAMDQLQDQSRYFGGMQGPAWSRVIADRTLNLSLLSSWTQAGKHAWGKAVMVEFADHTARTFRDLPDRLRSMLERYGLDSTDWDGLRLGGDGNPHTGLDMLTPMGVWETRQAAGLADTLHERYLEMILQEGEYAVPMGTLQAQASSYGNLRRGVLFDEIRRSAMQFKMFGMTLALTQGQRIVAETLLRGGVAGAKIAAGLVIGSTVLGALAIQLKELSRGKDPRPMNDARFWMAALVQGGGFGIFGDFLFAEENRVGGGLAETVAGPTVRNISQVLGLTAGNVQQGLKGENTNFGRELTRFVGQNTPFSSLWYLRLGYERIFLETLQELLDPEAKASFRRRAQQQRRNYGNDFFWHPGDNGPRRAPAIDNALGQ